MGAIPIESFDSSPFLNQKSELTLIEGEGFGAMMEATERWAPKFWGVEENNTALTNTITLHTRLIQLQKVLKKAPDQDPEINDWAFRKKADDIRVMGNSALKNIVTLQRQKKGGKNERPAIKRQHSELITDPDIVRSVFDSLLEDNDKAAQTIGLFEEWRLAEEAHAPNLENLRDGIDAFYVFLYAVRKTKMKNLVGGIAVQQHLKGE